MVTTIYFNGLKMYTELHDTPNGLNKWFAGGKWFLGKSLFVMNVFVTRNKVEIFLEQREFAFLFPSKICENLNFSREIQIFANFAGR